jgi:hypothetical protein
MYKLDTYYDGNLELAVKYSDPLQAFSDYLLKCIDVGFAKELATYNLSLPNGKMYTKNFNRAGFIGGK